MENQRPSAELRRKVENSVRKGRRAGRDEGTPGPKTPHVPRPAGAPYWLPVGPFWDRLAEGVRRAVGEILEPAYRRLVVEARDELERSAGMTLVHLMWLEICDQSHLGDTVGDRQAIYSVVQNPEESIARHLHLVAAKNSTAELLLKLRMVREMLERGERLASPPGAGPALPAPTRLAPTRASQDRDGYRVVGPDFPPPPELICGSEEPGIGKS